MQTEIHSTWTHHTHHATYTQTHADTPYHRRTTFTYHTIDAHTDPYHITDTHTPHKHITQTHTAHGHTTHTPFSLSPFHGFSDEPRLVPTCSEAGRLGWQAGPTLVDRGPVLYLCPWTGGQLQPTPSVPVTRSSSRVL